LICGRAGGRLHAVRCEPVDRAPHERRHEQLVAAAVCEQRRDPRDLWLVTDRDLGRSVNVRALPEFVRRLLERVRGPVAARSVPPSGIR
jgi:hypothetical protein